MTDGGLMSFKKTSMEEKLASEMDSAPDSFIDTGASIKYWDSVTPDVNGMLGGYPQISRIDLRGSASFLAKLRRLSSSADSAKNKLKLGVDCGAGIGRVTEGFLSNVCEVVDIVEPIDKFARVLGNSTLKAEGRVGEIYTLGLEQWEPPTERQYDLIWHQWCVGHLTDTQLTDHLRKCKRYVVEGGWIVVKENLSSDPEGKDLYDELDSSVTRTDQNFRVIFQEAGLQLVKSETQNGFPKGLGLYPVKMYALRPAA